MPPAPPALGVVEHGVVDEVVRIGWARESVEKLKEMGVKDYTLKEYAYLGHGADMEELDDVSAWLKERLPQ